MQIIDKIIEDIQSSKTEKFKSVSVRVTPEVGCMYKLLQAGLPMKGPRALTEVISHQIVASLIGLAMQDSESDEEAGSNLERIYSDIESKLNEDLSNRDWLSVLEKNTSENDGTIIKKESLEDFFFSKREEIVKKISKRRGVVEEVKEERVINKEDGFDE